MEKDYPIGTIIECFTADMQILKGLIVEHKDRDVKYGDNQSYKIDYSFIQLPVGCAGVIPYETVLKGTLEEADIIYEPFKEQSNREEVGISSIIISEGIKYLIVGINSRYMGAKQAGQNEYACIKYDEPDIFDLSYVFEDSVDEVLEYGYKLSNDLITDEYRSDYYNTVVSNFKAFLPIGSVVIVKSPTGLDLELTIIGRNKEVDGKVFDYVGVLYVLGFTTREKVFRFKKNQISEIKYAGYVNREENDLNIKMQEERQLIRITGGN